MSTRMNSEKVGAGRVVAVAIENNKTSQCAAKWAVDNLLPKDQTLLLVHVRQRSSSDPATAIDDMNDDVARAYRQQADNESKELFASFRVFCNRKHIQCKEVLLEGADIAKAIIEFVLCYSVELLVVGAPSRSGLIRRFRTSDVATSVTKGAPPFCTVYVISRGKISSVRSSTAKMPTPIEIPNQLEPALERPPHGTHSRMPDEKQIKSPFTRGGSGGDHRSYNYKPYEPSPDSDISFVGGGHPSIDRFFSSSTEDPMDGDIDARSFGSSFNSTTKSIDITAQSDFSFSSQDSGNSYNSRTSQKMEEVEAEMRRLKLELKQTMEMYSTACKEALTAKQKAMELQRWKMEEQRRLEEAKVAEEAALAIAEMEKARCRAALEAAEASKRMAEVEARKRMNAEMNALKKGVEGGARYRRYEIEEIEEATKCFSESLKIGEGGYGPVYRSELDHTAVAIKVLRPDAAQGRSQFQQEVQVLSCIRHPNMVLLLGACPEYGCLVYEYMANGSLEDRLFCRGESPPLSWQLRFRIAAEIGTGLLFLHQTRPEPLVHRDLKPGNILLDRNFVSKISDVGLARLVPPSVADTVTQYRMTATAGTFCYIDPEYQQTGMLGIKSDIYSLGIMFLQLITARPPMGLTHTVSRAIENGTLPEILDPAVEDWPLEQALHFAKISLQCAEMRKKDRPDLAKFVLPELNRLRDYAEERMPMSMIMFGAAAGLFSPSKTNGYSSASTSSSSDSFPAISGQESPPSTSYIARL